MRQSTTLGHALSAPLSWVPNTSSAQRAAYLAALSLVAIQVSIGIIMKAAQRGGSYSFSTSGSVAISESLKMLLSTMFFYKECKRRATEGICPSTRGSAAGYTSLPVNGDMEGSPPPSTPVKLNMGLFWTYIRGEVTKDVRYGFCNLALFYVLINNSIFLSYKMADPGTIQLTKSGVTLITALVMIATLGARVSKIQWMAIAMQISGLVVTQYQPDTGSTYSLQTYLILLFQVFLSALSGVYNQALLKADDSSLHADNMIMYAAGAGINLACHIALRFFKEGEPSFFEGYDSIGAMMVVASNVFIGLAITAVYKYADAVVKCFATAVATGILLYLSPIFFGTPLSFLVLPGTVIVFVASWLYMENPAPQDPTPTAANVPEKRGIFGKLAAASKRFSTVFLAFTTLLTVVIVVALALFEMSLPDLVQETSKTAVAEVKPDKEVDKFVVSPFKNTLAMIRWNSPHQERIPLLMKYEPFFHNIHISMPDMLNEEKREPEFHNLTHDQFAGTFIIYQQVARTMQLVLDTEPEIDGLLYYHFDAWVDPLAWGAMNRDNIHFPMTANSEDNHIGPHYKCMNDTQGYNWWGWEKNFHLHAKLAQSQVAVLDLGYKVDFHEWCVGWSDIYFIPRRFFEDFILLADIFVSFDVFHEVAIPTMVRIIEESHRKNPYTPLLEHISDCWGHCCASNPTIFHVLHYRCGHRLDYLEEKVIKAFYDKIDNEAFILGQPLNRTHLPELSHLFPPLPSQPAVEEFPSYNQQWEVPPDSEPAPKPEPKPEPKLESKPEPEPEPKKEQEPEPEPEPKPEPKPEPEPEPEPESKPELKPDLEPESEKEPEPEPEPEHKPDSKPEPDTKSDPEPEEDEEEVEIMGWGENDREPVEKDDRA
ncbi:CMP-sialic acid transporter 1 [Paramyrothecium foliicola]|nr:CMP-sialic acid transporter 1 [Paramyrothecium foliicola]